MIPVLYENTEYDFSSSGIGLLSGASQCVVSEVLNGDFMLTMQIMADSIHAESIDVMSIIKAKPSPYRQPQPFRVRSIRRTINGTMTVDALHIGRDLDYAVVLPFTAESAAEAVAHLTGTQFTVTCEITASGSFAVTVPQSFTKTIMEIAKNYGGMVLYDGLTVSIVSARGTGVMTEIAYGKNMTGMTQNVTTDETVKSILPYWRSDSSVIVGDAVPVPGAWTFNTVKAVDVSDLIDGTPTKQQVTAAGAIAVAEYSGLPNDALDVSFVSLGQTLEYSGIAALEQCDIGDDVTINHPMLFADVTAEVTQTDFDVLKEVYRKITVGKKQKSLTETLSGRA